MPRLALLVPVSLALSLAALACAAQDRPDYPPPDPYYPQYSTPYPPAYEAPPPRYGEYYRRPYPDYRPRRYRDDGERRGEDAGPYDGPPRRVRSDEGWPAPAYAQPRQPYAQPQYPSDEQRAAPPPIQSAPAAPPPYSPPPVPAASQAPSPEGQLLSPAQEGSRNLLTVAEAPLHDLNLIRQSIPQVLLTAMDDPYAAPSPSTCDQMALEIADLSQAVGPDYDDGAPQKSRGVAESGGLGLSLMHSAAANLLPFHSYVSTLSGAAKHDELIMKALSAGAARRAYLKGLGEARGCPSPASPSRLNHPPIRLSDDSRKPYYPIR
jgi:hypothetical protein